ncbi:MAG: CHAT domain-containing tetratricopeptide repeat protein [Acidobacteriota bacterium]
MHQVLSTLSPLRTRARWLLMVALLLLPACGDSPPEEAREPTDQGALRSLGEGTLGALEKHRWNLEIPQGYFIRLVLEQRDVDVLVRLIDPDGETVAEGSGPGGSWVEERFAAITSTAGRHQLEIHALEKRTGGYRLRLEEQRPSQPGDEARIQAEALLQDGRHLRHVASQRLQAVERLFDAAELWSELEEPDREALALDEAADLLLELGRLERGLEAVNRAAAMTEMPQIRAKILETRGWLKASLGKEGAEADLQESLRITESDPAGLQRADTLDGLTSFRLSERLPQQALEFARESLEIRQAQGDLAGLATTLGNLAIIHDRLSDGPDLIHALHQRSTEYAERARRWSQVVVSWNNWASFNRKYGHYETARLQSERALRFAEQLEETLALVESEVGLGQVLHSMQDFAGAVEHFERAQRLVVALDLPAKEADIANRLAYAQEALGNLEQAIEQSGRATQLAPSFGFYKVAMGRLLRKKGDLEGSYAILQESLRQVSHSSSRCSALLELGDTEKERGNAFLAREHLYEALELAKEDNSPGWVGAAYSRLARFEAGEDRLETARQHAEAGLRINEVLRSSLPDPDQRAIFASKLVEINETNLLILVKSHRENPAAGFDRMALEASEKVRSRALIELLTEARDDVRQGLSQELKAEEDAILQQISKYQTRLSLLAPDDERRQQVSSDLEDAERRWEDLEARIRRNHAPYADVAYPEPISADEIQSRLAPGSALLEYFLGKNHSYLFIVRPDGLVIQDLNTAEEIENTVIEARGALEDRFSSPRDLFLKTHPAYELLIEPAVPFLEGIDHLIIAPDRKLHLLPFEALWNSDGPPPVAGRPARSKDFLLSQWAVSYLPSAATLRSLSKAGRSTAFQLVAFAYSGSNGEPSASSDDRSSQLSGQLPSLSHVAEEVRDLAGLFPRNRVSVIETATEDRIKELAGRGGLLHFAAHGEIDEEVPMRSALVFARSPTDDGRLQVPEIFNLKLNADLAVLSACETGLGKEVRGEGLIGLSRAFFSAGVRSLMVSLWSVDDRSTRDLMQSFYRGLRDGQNSVDASQQAKISMIEQREGEYSHPYFWAPFVLVGPAISLAAPDPATIDHDIATKVP